MKFGPDSEVEFKKCFELYSQILAIFERAIMTIILSILCGIDESEWNAAKILQNFQVSLAKFSKNLFAFYKIWQKIMKFNKL
jgi:hypothetical protein